MNTFEKLTSLKQTGKRPETSAILTTPESIVREHRAQVLQSRGPILGRAPEPVPWQARIDWDFVLKMISYACGVALGLVGIYMLAWVLIPFLQMIRWQ
jgi:hypothetical protein